MEKTCEFCGVPGAVVYCTADAALLCLSCDSKVHSANALFSRHSRTLLCDSCKGNSACVRCLDHLMLLCKDCESRLHKRFSNHRMLMIGSYTGCPSANDFATLWGINVNDLHQLLTADSAASVISSDAGMSSCSQQYKKLNNHHQQNKGYIIHQILDLKNLQLTERENQTKTLRHHGDVTTSSMPSTSATLLNESLKQPCKALNCLSNELQSLDNPSQALKGERFSLPTSQQDHLPPSVIDPFWQYNKSLVDNNNQFWSQNLQDLGMCQEVGGIDDFNMPEVDVTFHNFEDLLTGDPDLTRAFLEDNDPMSSDIEKASMNKFEKCPTEPTQNITVASKISTNKHIGFNKEANSPDHLFRYSRSATFSCSQLSAESSGCDFIDSGSSGNFTRGKSSNTVAELQGVKVSGESSIRLSKEKKKTRMHSKKNQLAPRKARTDLHKRDKSRYA